MAHDNTHSNTQGSALGDTRSSARVYAHDNTHGGARGDARGDFFSADGVDATRSRSNTRSNTHSDTHDQTEEHHRHRHTTASQHRGGHHLLQVENLSIGFSMYDPNCSSFFKAKKREVKVIEDLSISVHAAEIVALVGASGSGKTLLADALMGIYEPNVTVRGNIWFDGVLQDAASLTALRGKDISLVPQSINHLDPLAKVSKLLASYCQRRSHKHERATRVNMLLRRYRLDSAVLEKYPFELSGGMARRTLLMMALLDEPKVIIADEPTPGLDLELAIKALEDFRNFANEGGGVLLITHDIELALKVADRVAVFKEGTVVEETAVANFGSPSTLRNSFSKQLWHALPEHDFRVPAEDSRQGGTQRDAPRQGTPQQDTPSQGTPQQGGAQQDAPRQGGTQ